MQRSINFSKDICILYYQRFLIIKGQYTQFVLSTLNLKIVGLSIIFDNNNLISMNSTVYNDNMLTLTKQINLAINGVVKFYYKKLTITGIGFKGWLVDSKKKITLKIGYSKNILLKIPNEVIIIFLKPSLIIVKGPSKEITNFVAAQIRFLKRINIYKNKGILNENEIVQLKPGKQK
jgi:ribosomal protein L6P/L9E